MNPKPCTGEGVRVDGQAQFGFSLVQGSLPEAGVAERSLREGGVSSLRTTCNP